MALADSFDAMTVERPYSKAQPYREAIRGSLKSEDPV